VYTEREAHTGFPVNSDERVRERCVETGSGTVAILLGRPVGGEFSGFRHGTVEEGHNGDTVRTKSGDDWGSSSFLPETHTPGFR
jgi:hypothetical protein